jgi:small basic protein
MLPVLALILGMLLGYYVIPHPLPLGYAKYISVAFLAVLDSILGAVRSGMENKFNPSIFVSGFVTNAVVGGLLTFVGDWLGVDLYLAAVITFGVRIFQNLAAIRRDLLNQPQSEKFRL